MATPASRFRPHGPSRQITMPTAKDDQIAGRGGPWLDSEVIDPPSAPVPRSAAVEFETWVPASGNVTMVSGRQAVTVRQGMAGRTLTIWVDLHSVHLVLDVHVLRIVASWLLPQDLAFLAMRGARPTGPPPAPAEIQRCGCTSSAIVTVRRRWTGTGRTADRPRHHATAATVHRRRRAGACPRPGRTPAPPQRRCPRRGEHRMPFAQAGRADLAGTRKSVCFGR